MSNPDLEEASISIPSIAFVAVLGFILYRYFFSSSPSPTRTSPGQSSQNNTLRFTPAQVDQVSAMFPQLPRRDIMWDLHRNRGNVAATTERVLMGGRLEPAPASFQPSLPPSMTSTAASPGSSTASTIKQQSREPDLITRYNLQNRVDVSGKGKGREETEGPNHGWASSKDERQAMLKRRRDEMILAARRKMQEKEEQMGGGVVGVEAT